MNSCTPLQGLITQVSLEILATETPGGRGAGKRTDCNVHHASAALLRKSSSSRTFLLERIYFTSLSKMSSSIFSSVQGLRTFNQSSSLYAGTAYVTDTLLSSKMQRWQLHEFPFGRILRSSITLSLPYFAALALFLQHLNSPSVWETFVWNKSFAFLYAHKRTSESICKIYSCLMPFRQNKWLWNGNFLQL